jgi:hypothetical protein
MMSPRPNVWDSHPQYVNYKGQTIETFTRGALSKALNREYNSIRAMERKGVLCHPRLKNGRGVWMYTRDQIDDLIKLADEENVMDPRRRNVFSDRFIAEAHAILSRLP